MLIRSLVALSAGASMALAFPPLGLIVTLPLGIAILVLITRERSVAQALLPGLAFGIGFMFLHLSWMRGVGYDAWLALASVQALYFVLLAAGLASVTRLPGWPLWSAALYVGVEVVRGAFPLGGLPWGRLAYATVDTVWAAGLPWFGASGVSLLLALTGTTLAWLVVAWRGDDAASRRRPLLALAAVGIVTFAPVLVPHPVGEEDDRRVHVAAVQGNVPGDGSDVLLDHRQVTRNHVDATVRLAEDMAAGRVERPAFVLWPENSTAVDPFRDLEINGGIQEASDAIGIPVVVGAIVDGPDRSSVLNQGIVWEPGIGAGDRYTKRHPVPFGEYIPWRDRVFRSNFGNLSRIPRDMFSGRRVEPLRIGNLRVADAICFDIAYDDGIHAQLRAGAELLVVQTSNAMFIHTHQIEQQFAISRLRAIESGRYVMVAATNGVSGIIAPDGRVLERAGIRTQAALVEEVGLRVGLTPAVRLGPWPGRAAVLVGAAAMLLPVVPYRRRRREGSGRGKQS